MSVVDTRVVGSNPHITIEIGLGVIYNVSRTALPEEMPFRPELALTRLQLAELLLEHYPNEKKEAIEHLDFCIKEFRDMKMQPSLEQQGSM